MKSSIKKNSRMVMFRISCRDPLTFHVTIDDGVSAAMACWRSWSSSNLIPRLTRVMVHWHPYNETYQSRNVGRDPAIFHVTIDERISTSLACWISRRSPNLIPRLTRVIIHLHPCNETYQSGNNGCFSRRSTGPTGHLMK
ncbi:unnamed protein product [Clavelina lepadiformis]|uniref:Uncharacterized protein n=1 Tax=Clavelina lepadiformis TaxID=159417 RepID=A0ABP0G5R9_CLALP